MDRHHELGFKQFAGPGLRYVAEWRGKWLALVGWQTEVFQCRPRDQWLKWHWAVQFRRLHLCANNTRFLVLPEWQGVPDLASRVLGPLLRIGGNVRGSEQVSRHVVSGGELDQAGVEQGLRAQQRAARTPPRAIEARRVTRLGMSPGGTAGEFETPSETTFQRGCPPSVRQSASDPHRSSLGSLSCSGSRSGSIFSHPPCAKSPNSRTSINRGLMPEERERLRDQHRSGTRSLFNETCACYASRRRMDPWIM